MNRFIQRIKDAYTKHGLRPTRCYFFMKVPFMASCGLGAATIDKYNLSTDGLETFRVIELAEIWIKNKSFRLGFECGFDTSDKTQRWIFHKYGSSPENDRAYRAGYKLGRQAGKEIFV